MYCRNVWKLPSSKEVFKNMIKKIGILITTIIVFFSFLIPINGKAQEETLGSLRKDYEAKLKAKQDNDNKSDQAKKEIAAKEKAIGEAEENIAKAKKEEENTQEQINESNEKIEKLTKEVNNVLKYLQEMKSQNAYLKYVTGASSMTDLITRIAAMEQMSKSIHETMTNLENEIKQNENLKKELQEKQETSKKQIANYQAAIKQLHNNIEEYDQFAPDLATQLNQAKTKYENTKRQCLATLGKDDDSIVTSTCYNFATNSTWLKPLTKGYVTSNIGSRWGSYHNALDIGGNSEGTPVYAAASGIVSGKISKYKCGGNMLYIDVVVNGVQYTTYYYHLLRFNVNVGDTVDQNTIIGYVGGGSTSTSNGGYDQCTTGPHLHFGVSKGWFTGTIYRANVITPPGFPNQEGYRFYSRYDYYR